jgi:hypothetical protein
MNRSAIFGIAIPFTDKEMKSTFVLLSSKGRSATWLNSIPWRHAALLLATRQDGRGRILPGRNFQTGTKTESANGF